MGLAARIPNGSSHESLWRDLCKQILKMGRQEVEFVAKEKTDEGMDTGKLERWAELLLDTGKRNQLIHFRDTRFTTAEILLPAAEVLFDRIDGAASFEIFHPGLEIEEETEEGEKGEEGREEKNGAEGTESSAAGEAGEAKEKESEEKQPEKKTENAVSLQKEPSSIGQDGQEDRRQAWLDRYASRLRKQSQLLVYNALANPMAAIQNIAGKAREFEEETGVNVAYMAFGFIHWKEQENSSQIYRAPALLVPVRLEQESVLSPWQMKVSEDEIVVNPTFSYKMEAEYGEGLPEYDDEGLEAYLEKLRKMAAKLHWNVTGECRLGIFSFLKMNMYRDLQENGRRILENTNVRRLLGEPGAGRAGAAFSDRGDRSEKGEEKLSPSQALTELHSVVDADSSQMEAIEMAKTGKSFVLQGPPGTGKSQTITNIIAECLSDGKKVLFVSEKQAALNVVYDKLKQAGLSEFCLELHSHKANKKRVIADICHTLRLGKCSVSPRAEQEIAAKEKAVRILDAYAAELHRPRPVIGKSLYQLYGLYASLRHLPDVEWAVPRLTSRGGTFLADAVSLLEQYVDYIPVIGPDYHNYPWYGCTVQDTSYQRKIQLKADLTAAAGLFEELEKAAEEIRDCFQVPCRSAAECGAWRRFFQAALGKKLFAPALLGQENFRQAEEIIPAMEEKCRAIREGKTEIAAGYDEEIYKINGQEAHKKLTRLYGSLFSRMFSREYRQIIEELQLCRKDGKRIFYQQAVSLTERLGRIQELTEQYGREEEQALAWLGPDYRGLETDWEEAGRQMAVIREMFGMGMSFGRLAEEENLPGAEGDDSALEYFAKRLECCQTLEAGLLPRLAGCFREDVIQIQTAPVKTVREKFTGCLEEIERLDSWRYFQKLLSDLEEKQLRSFLDQAVIMQIEGKKIPGAFRKLFYGQWIGAILSDSPFLSRFSRGVQDRAVEVFAQKDREQFDINRARIRAELSADRPSLDMIAVGSPLAVLLREGEKKRRQKSIRTLLDETGELVQRVKPCFLMSPLSVSTFLTPDAVHFDVVIFDEASQIFPQDAIGAIYRGDQLIVVGDSRQMPPTSFFSAVLENENEDGETGDVTDFESILDLCAASMPQLRLRWHYRSRYEELIAFSNRNFYDNELITFPSARAEGPGAGVEYVYADGVFDRKSHTNRKEAELTVELIYRHIAEHPERSLGVVAFSAAQQELIGRLLSRRRQSAPEQEFFFRREGTEPFFIKNLETVQGDERDTIIFSIAYGKDSQGRLFHNFGPLNQAGGERRLNVAITRAKYHILVVSSMRAPDIDLSRSSAEGVRLLRAYLDFAENGMTALERTLTVPAFEQYDSDFEMEVCEFLREKGYAVDTQVGCSGFRIDMGLKRPGSSDYVLAIECDGASYHSAKNARDRDRLRQEILEGMGWKFYRIWSTDWFRSRDAEEARLLEAAEKALRRPEWEGYGPEEEADEWREGGTEERSGEEENGEEGDSKEGDGKESFEEPVPEEHFSFPPYQAADLDALAKQYLPQDYQGMVRAILELESPLSENLLLKRTVGYFGREKVTSVVQRAFEREMTGCREQGILRKGGFLYLRGARIQFRRPGDLHREIRQIAPEELAAGMLAILRQNTSASQSGLYRVLALQCGVTRVGKAVNEAFDAALECLGNRVETEGEMISLAADETNVNDIEKNR